mmetsp:Transcript_53216/g.168978  ORF Transcript_53216/g.168978 Transcript_53216/m.168978 type:complete len:254 (+) Transcript_53216:837-1598(+)
MDPHPLRLPLVLQRGAGQGHRRGAQGGEVHRHPPAAHRQHHPPLHEPPAPAAHHGPPQPPSRRHPRPLPPHHLYLGLPGGVGGGPPRAGELRQGVQVREARGVRLLGGGRHPRGGVRHTDRPRGAGGAAGRDHLPAAGHPVGLRAGAGGHRGGRHRGRLRRGRAGAPRAPNLRASPCRPERVPGGKSRHHDSAPRSASAPPQMVGRTAYEAPDIDPIVFLTDDPNHPPLAIGEMRKCVITSASIFDLEASPVC